MKYECSVEGSSLSKSKYLPQLFDTMMDENDLNIMVNLPGNSKKIAKDLNITSKEASGSLKDLYMRGFLWIKEGTKNDPEYCFGDIGLFMDSILFDKKYFKYGEEFYELWKKYLNKEHIQMYQAEGGFRVLPVEESISKKEVIESSKIIPQEKASEILMKAKKIAVASCPCRTREKRCDNPLETCIALNDLAEYEISRGMAREIDLDEALEILRIGEEHGLIHETVNSDTPDVICNCCSCCCSFLRTILVYGIEAATARSRFMANFDTKKCKECKDKSCVGKCIFGGIKTCDGNLIIDPCRCWGCGLCTSVCPSGAITMKEVRGEEHIPANQTRFFKYDNIEAIK